MPAKRTPSPKSTIRARARLPKIGDEITVRVKVTRIGRNTWDTADTLTVMVPGYPVPVTATARYLLGEDDE